MLVLSGEGGHEPWIPLQETTRDGLSLLSTSKSYSWGKVDGVTPPCWLSHPLSQRQGVVPSSFTLQGCPDSF